MLCAHAVRRVKPDAADQFIEAFKAQEDKLPPGWVRFHALRGLADENEVVTFGFFDGTLEELERSQAESDYQGLRDTIDPLVETVVANAVYEVIVSWTAE